MLRSRRVGDLRRRMRRLCVALTVGIGSLIALPQGAAATTNGTLGFTESGYVQNCGPQSCTTIWSSTTNYVRWTSTLTYGEGRYEWDVAPIQLEIYLYDPNSGIRACCGPLRGSRSIDLYDSQGSRRYTTMRANSQVCWSNAYDPGTYWATMGCNPYGGLLPYYGGGNAGTGDYWAYVTPGSGVVGGWGGHSGRFNLGG